MIRSGVDKVWGLIRSEVWEKHPKSCKQRLPLSIKHLRVTDFITAFVIWGTHSIITCKNICNLEAFGEYSVAVVVVKLHMPKLSAQFSYMESV